MAKPQNAAHVYVYSTLTADQHYTTWKPLVEGQQVREAEHTVIIKGGANTAQAGVGSTFFTPRGIVTKITANDYEHLLKNDQYNFHLKRGHIQVEVVNRDVEKVTPNMKAKDNSAPLSKEEFETVANQGNRDPEKDPIKVIEPIKNGMVNR